MPPLNRRMPPPLQPVSLSPPKGQALVLTDNETWIGRTSFKLTWDGQLLCSRRQACLKITNTAVTLECHGVNPMYFVVCHSVNFQASEDTPPSMLHPLRRGEEVEVVDGDKFFLVLKECLLTVGIKPSKSDGDVAAAAAAVQPTPGTVHFNILDGRSLPDQVCSLETTQLVPASTCSPVEHNCFVCPSDESCKCSGVRNPPSGLQGPLVKDSPARQVTFSNTATSGHPISREVVTDIRRSTDASKSTVVSDDQPAAPEFSRLDSSGARDLLNLTSGGTVAPGSSVEGKGCGSSNDASKGILVPFFQPGTLNCGLDPIGPSTTVNCQADAQEACKQITTSSIYGRASSPPLAASGDPAPCGITINNRWPIGASQTAIVPYDGHVPELLRLDSSPTGGPSVNSTQGCTVATSSSVEGRGRVLGPSNDTVGESLVQSIYLDNVAYGLDSRGTAEPVAKSFVDAHEAGQQIGTRNVSSCTSSPLCPELNRIQDDMPCAVTSGLDPHQGPTLPRQLSLVQGNNTQSDFPPEAVSSPQSPSLDGVSSGLAMTIHERRELSLKQPEIVDLTGSKDEIDAQAQIQSESVQVGHAVCNNLRDPIEGMENIIVTISGYNDVLRSRLINLISVTGASYTGSLTNINTHVVCWKFRGEKYEMAKKLGKSIVNHCWFEDCRKAGMRLPEGLYRASGKVAAPLCWDRSSSMQHPPSTAGFDHDQDCNSLPLKEHSLGQARPAPVIGCPSTDTGKRGEISCRSALLSRNENGMLDRGKRHVDLDSSANRLQGGNLRTIAHDCQDARQVTPLARSGNSGNFPATNLSTSHHAEQDESDEFWNEAFREYDDRNNQVSEHSCEVSSNANHRAGLMERRTGMRRPAASPSPGSSLRDLDPEIRSGTRDALANEAGSSGVAQGEIHQEAMPSPSVGEQSDDVHSETDHIIGYPEVFRRKRKRASASTVLGDSPNQVGGVASAIKWVVIAGRPTPLSSDAAQERASTLDTKDDRQQIAGVIDAESVGKAEEKRGESASSNEIACVICHSDTKAINEGVLACGHQFCYPCIQRWADEARSRTCPLCKVPFDFITFREMGKAGEDGSRTVLEERIVQLSHQRVQETGLTNRSMLRSERCVRCGSADTPELFLICTPCGERACHSFCLDPPRPPGSFWSCARCSRMRFTTETRDTYGRIFQGGQSSARRRQDIPDVGMSLAQQSRTSNRGGALVRHQSSATPLRLNLAPQRGSTSHVGGLAPGQSSDTAPRRARQHSLHKFLVRQNDV